MGEGHTNLNLLFDGNRGSSGNGHKWPPSSWMRASSPLITPDWFCSEYWCDGILDEELETPAIREKVTQMKLSTLLLVIFSSALLLSAQDEPSFETNSDQIEGIREHQPEMIERALVPIRTHFAAYYEGDMKKMRSAWRKKGIVETQTSVRQGGFLEFKIDRSSIDSWIDVLQAEIDTHGLSTWTGSQFQPGHGLHLTVLHINPNGALILVEDPLRYSMGPLNPVGVMFRNHSAILFKVAFNALPSGSSTAPVSHDATILQMTLEPSNGC